jgi:hypothetical protein
MSEDFHMGKELPNASGMNYGPAVLSKNLEALETLAKQRGKPLRRFWHVDPNVGRSTIDPTATTPPPDAFVNGISFRHLGYRSDVEVNDEFVLVNLTWPGDRGLVFSINRRDRVILTEPTPTYIGPNKTLRLFVSSVVKNDESAFHADSEVTAAIRRLNLAPEESLHGSRGQLSLYLKSDGPEAVSNRVEALSRLATLFSSVGTKEPEIELPPEFHHLLPLARRWAVTDDEERTERLTHASSSTRRQLVEKVKPHFDRINEYFASLGETPPSDAAIFLGALAECATEAMLMEDRAVRKKRD